MDIIPKKPADVDAEQHADENKNANLTKEDGNESIDTNDVSVACYFWTAPSVILKEKISFRGLLESDGHRFKKSGNGHKCLCPFHDERTASFYIYPNDNYAKCYGCGWKGSIFDYVMGRDQVDFKAALKILTQFYEHGTAVNRIVSSQKPSLPGEVYVPSEAERKIMANAAIRLMDDERLQHRVADRRNWKTSTILKLAQEGCLGWDDALAFIYPTGIKYRNWPKKDFFWGFGHQSLWRVNKLETASCVYLTEGETDAISMIDAGFENTPGVAVVCMPGASSFKDAWAPLFAGKKVTLCFDNDLAGETATGKVADLLHPYATQLLTFNPREVA